MRETAPLPPSAPSRRATPALIGATLIALLALASTLTGLGNGFPQDDGALVLHNEVVHGLSRWRDVISRPYWPAYLSSDLYRPLTSLGFAAQWQLGNGVAAVFHGWSLILYAAGAVLLFLVLLDFVPLAPAWLAAALFAVHPLHSEAVAEIVNQSDLAVGVIGLVATWWYLSIRRRGDPPVAARLGLAALLLASCGFKESGLMLLPTLAAAEWLLVDDARPWRVRLRALAPTAALMSLLAFTFLVIRSQILGDVVGSFTAAGLKDFGLLGRTRMMLGVVPVIAKLLLWPSDLRIDYAPQEIPKAYAFGLPQATGLLIVGVALVGFWQLRRRCPPAAFGLAWFGITFFPVSNLLVPTGIVLGERTLYVPSMGLAIPLATGLAWLLARATTPATRTLVAAGAATLLGLGLVTLREAMRPWFGSATLYRAEVLKGTQSYRVYWQFGTMLSEMGKQAEARELLEKSYALYDGDPIVIVAIGDTYMRADDCAHGVPWYRKALATNPDFEVARAQLAVCAAWSGDYATARRVAHVGMAHGRNQALFREFAALADSAERLHQPPRSVNLYPVLQKYSRIEALK